MKKLLILFFLLLFPTLCIAGFNHENFVYGTMSSDPLLAADTTGNTFTLELATNSERLPAGLVRLVIYSASCSQPSSCANREIIDIDSGVEPIYCTTGPPRVCTAKLKTHNVETTSYSGNWSVGDKWALNITAESFTDDFTDYRDNNYFLAQQFGRTYKDENTQYITFASGENYPHSILYINNMLFLGLNTNVSGIGGKILKFANPNNLSSYTVLNAESCTGCTAGECDRIPSMVYVPEVNKIYAIIGEQLAPIRILEINPDTLSCSVVVSSNIGTINTGGSIVSDGTYLYVVTSESPSKILKYTIGTWVETYNTLTYNFGHSIQYDGTYLYVTYLTSPSAFTKINPSNLTFVDTVLASGYNNCTDDIISVGDYIWCGIEGVGDGRGKIAIMNKSDYSLSYLNLGETSAIYGLFFDGRYVWIGYATAPGTIIRLDPSTMSYSKYTFPSDYNYPNEFMFDGNRLFVSFYSSPGRLARFSLPYFTTNNYVGNASTATALAANPTEVGCGAGVYATAIDASGNLTCTAQVAETDPQVGTLTNTKWCTTDGSAINCQQDTPAKPSGSLYLSAAGGWPSLTSGCATNNQSESTTNDVNYWTLDFDATTDENAEWSVVMPSDWNAGTVTAKFYWTANSTSTNTVMWCIKGGCFADNAAIDTAYGTAVCATADANGSTALTMRISAATDNVTMANAAASQLCQFKVYRDVSEDDLAVDAKLIGVMITFTRS